MATPYVDTSDVSESQPTRVERFHRHARIGSAVIIFTLLGSSGQAIYSRMDSSRTDTSDVNLTPRPSLLARFAEARWSPMQNLSDEQYEDLLKEKLLRIDAEIALIDERIEDLQRNGDPKNST